jgi:hypothetical protein
MAFLNMGFQDPLGAAFKSARGTDHAGSAAIRQVPATQNHYYYVSSAQDLVLFLKSTIKKKTFKDHFFTKTILKQDAVILNSFSLY